MSLPPQQELFCQEYLAARFNGSQAYRRAYPTCKSEKSARTNAARLLANAGVKARVEELKVKAAAAAAITPAQVLRELGFVAFQRKSQLYRPDGSLKSPDEWDEATDATVAGLETEEERTAAGKVRSRVAKVKRWDKVRALELFMKHFGLLKEDAPHPDRPAVSTKGMSDVERAALLAFLRSLGR